VANEEFAFRLREETERTIVVIRGEIDLSNADDLSKALTEAATRNVPVVVEASELAFIDSAGFAAIQRLMERATVLLVVPPTCPTARGFGVSGLGQIVPFFESLDEARAATGDEGS